MTKASHKALCGFGRQVLQSRSAFVSFGMSTTTTDFIFSIAGEEFGPVATIGLVIAFGILLFCGTFVAYHAHDRFGRLMALGLTVMLTFEAGFNIGMVTGLLPTKGLALPFISYGGTSMFASLVAAGLIISVGNTSANEEMAPLMRDACQSL